MAHVRAPSADLLAYRMLSVIAPRDDSRFPRVLDRTHGGRSADGLGFGAFVEVEPRITRLPAGLPLVATRGFDVGRHRGPSVYARTGQVGTTRVAA